MKSVFFSPAAVSDVQEIYDQISSENLTAANRILDEFETSCASLGRHPRMGVARGDLLPGIRLVVVSQSYVVFYRILDDAIEIVRVVHGRRDYSKLFDL